MPVKTQLKRSVESKLKNETLWKNINTLSSHNYIYITNFALFFCVLDYKYALYLTGTFKTDEDASRKV